MIFTLSGPKEHVAFLHPKLDLSPMDIFKVICDAQLVNYEECLSSDKPYTSPVKYFQVDHDGNKVVEEINLEETGQQNSSEEMWVPKEG